MMRYRGVLLMVACLALNGVLHARSAGDGGRVATPDSAQESKTRAAPDAVRPRQTPKPAATFNPSEKIGADSAVSFPVDI